MTSPRMHRIFQFALASAAAAITFGLLLLFTGCAASAPGATRSLAPVITRTNAAPEIVTNQVTQIVPVVVTNADSITVTNYVTNLAHVVSTNWQTNIVSAVNPIWTQTIDGARAVNSTLNPTPSAPFVNIGLTALSGVLGWFAAWQNRRRARATGLLNTVIAGVEAAKNPDVKKAIAETSKLWGTRNELAAHVAQVTSAGPNPS